MDELASAFPRLRRVLVACGIVVALFLAVPLLVILPPAFTSGPYLTFPPQGFSLQWFARVVSDPAWRAALLNSVQVAAGGAALATVGGTCAALAVRRLGRGRQVWRTVLVAPMVLPNLVLALGLYLSYRSVFGGSNLATLTIGQAVLAMPLVFLTVSSALASVSPSLSRAAESLGFRWPSVVLRVELPLARRGVAAAAVIAFAVCFDEAVLAYFLAPPGALTLPVMIWRSASESASPAIAAASALVISVAAGLLALTMLLGPRRRAKGTP